MVPTFLISTFGFIFSLIFTSFLITYLQGPNSVTLFGFQINSLKDNDLEETQVSLKLKNSSKTIEKIFYQMFEEPKRVKFKPKILCILLTHPQNYETKLRDVMNSWGRRCDHTLIVTSKLKSKLDDLIYETKQSTIYRINLKEDNRDQIWFKVKSALLYAHKHFLNKFQWFYRADDDTFVIMENMKHFLADKNFRDNLYYGFRYKVYGGYDAGSSQIFSQKTLETLVDQGFNSQKKQMDVCRTNNAGVEDVQMGWCLKQLNVTFGNATDKENKQMILPLNVGTFLSTYKDYVPKWFHEWTDVKIKKGTKCCSNSPISYHYVSKLFEQRILDYFIRRINKKFLK